jgi:deoxyribose-phosphate aldolase
MGSGAPHHRELFALDPKVASWDPARMDAPGSARELATWIDHTLLKPEAGGEAIDRLCAEARARGIWSVCVNPIWIARAGAALQGSEVRVCTVIGFPLGACAPEVKAFEAARAVEAGADELDMVVAIGALLDGRLDEVERDIAGVVAAARGKLVKVILETALLDEQAIVHGCERALAGGAGYVKTSTGFGPGGATLEAVRRMRAVVGSAAGVKASGGIRDAATARAMIEAGASRLGTSASLAILDAWSRP